MSGQNKLQCPVSNTTVLEMPNHGTGTETPLGASGAPGRALSPDRWHGDAGTVGLQLGAPPPPLVTVLCSFCLLCGTPRSESPKPPASGEEKPPDP